MTTTTISIPDNGSITELNTLLVQAISENAGQDVIGKIAIKLSAAANEVQEQENDRTRIANLKKAIANHVYGERATEILITRNMDDETKNKLAPPEVLVNFLKIYEMKEADGNSRICVSDKELNKCQELLTSGRTLGSITLEDLKKKGKADNPSNSDDEGTGEESGTDNDDVPADKTDEA